MTDTKQKLFDLIALAVEKGLLRKLTLSLPSDGSFPVRRSGRLSSVRGRTTLTLEQNTEGGKVNHLNIPQERLSECLLPLLSVYGRVYLSVPDAEAEFLRSKKGKETLLGETAVREALSGIAENRNLLPFNREIRRFILPDAPFLYRLGISDDRGRIHDKKQAKYRQINRFIEHADFLYGELPQDGTLSVYDLCCGKSYLSFALYYYLHECKGRDVSMYCVDIKEDVIAECREIASDIGFGGMTFAASDIRQIPKDRHPDMVVSLHACDIATDIVLDTAAALGARVILSTPCCHRYLRDRLHCEPLSFVYRFPHLRTRLGEVLTDALRIEKLACEGYRAEAVELIDPEDTPKNTLIRAVRQKGFQADSEQAAAARAAYSRTLTFLFGEDTSYRPQEVTL